MSLLLVAMPFAASSVLYPRHTKLFGFVAVCFWPLVLPSRSLLCLLASWECFYFMLFLLVECLCFSMLCIHLLQASHTMNDLTSARFSDVSPTVQATRKSSLLRKYITPCPFKMCTLHASLHRQAQREGWQTKKIRSHAIECLLT